MPIPIGFCAAALAGTSILVAHAVLVITIYSLVWLRFWPTRFVVHQDVLEFI